MNIDGLMYSQTKVVQGVHGQMEPSKKRGLEPSGLYKNMAANLLTNKETNDM